jgi:hypothetical protein
MDSFVVHPLMINFLCRRRHGPVATHRREGAAPNEFIADLAEQACGGSSNSCSSKGMQWHGQSHGPSRVANDSPQRKGCNAIDRRMAMPAVQERAGVGDEQRLALRQKRYNLDAQVRTWSDYLRPHLHPRSVDVMVRLCTSGHTCTQGLVRCGLPPSASPTTHLFRNEASADVAGRTRVSCLGCDRIRAV